jgi:hypothetical protein
MLIAVEHPSPLWAYHPFATEDAAVLHPLQFAAEIGHDYKETGDGDRSFAGNYTASSGLIRNIELDLTVPVIYHLEKEKNGDGGAGDLDLRAKLGLIPEKKWRPAFTFAGSVIFPTGDANRNLGSPKTNYRALSVWTKTAGRLTAHANAAGTLSTTRETAWF